jgi:hypothetical protein
MTNKTCSEPRCIKSIRARGLCSTHYNQQHQPKRHVPKLVTCCICGEPCEKSTRRANTVCSYACRWFVQNQRHSSPVWFPTCNWCGAVFATRKPDDMWCSTECQQVTKGDWPTCKVYFVNCAWCSKAIVTRQPNQAVCSRACSRRMHRARRRAREAGAPGSYTWSEVTGLLLAFDRRCAYCQRPITSQVDPDHVVPLSRGGSNAVTNILPTCHPCNGDKRDLLLHEWAADRERRGLPPRVTTWSVDDRRYWHLTEARLSLTS